MAVAWRPNATWIVSTLMPDRLTRRFGDSFVAAAALCVVAGAALSAWTLYLDDVINNDGIEYIRAAMFFNAGQWEQALQTYKWPFYSLCIAWLQALTGLDYELVAHLFNGVTYAGLVVTFLAVVRAMGGSSRTIWIAALVILTHPIVNEFRSFLIRDPAYVTLYLAGVLYMFRFFSPQGSMRHGLLSALLFSVSALFRIEGLVFALLVPALYLTRRLRGRVRLLLLLSLFALLLVVFLVVFGWWMFTPTHDVGFSAILDRPSELLALSWQQLGADFVVRAETIESDVLPDFADGYAYILMLVAVVLIMFAETLAAVTIVYALLIWYGVRHHYALTDRGLRFNWTVLVATNAVILAIFVFAKTFLTTRYTLGLLVTLLLVAPSILETIYLRWRSRAGTAWWRRSPGFPALVLVIFLFSLDGVSDVTEKQHLKAAGLWLKENAGDGRLLLNDRKMAYYAGEMGGRQAEWYDWQIFLKRMQDGVWTRCDYVAVRMRKDNQRFLDYMRRTLKSDPILKFENDRDDIALIYRVPKPGGS